MAQEHKTLLNLVRLLHQAYEGGRPTPFNLFSVLRGPRDEVRLHSRFLAALLDHRDLGTKGRENLRNFVRTVLKIDDRFDWTKSMVEAESRKIDILITLANQVAIVIENKIDAPDQDRQLYRYVKIVRGMGFEEIHPVYLTPRGDSPSSASLGCMETSDPESHGRLQCLGYNSEVFQDWLKGCQKRAFDQPELRGSIVQYLRLVQELTHTDRKGGYMEALKELLKQGDNLSLAIDIREAIQQTQTDLELDLWKAMREELKKTTGLDFRDDGAAWKALDEAVSNRHYPDAKKKYFYGIIYPLCGYRTLELRVMLGRYRLRYGVSGRDHRKESMEGEKEYETVKTMLENHPDPNGESHPAWPCLRYASTTHADAIASREDADRLVEEIAEGMKAIYGAITASAGE